MPLYEYECDACGRRFEVIQKFSDQSVETCKHCGKGPVRRLVSSPAIQFKGSGWYVTDYAQKGKSDSSSSGSSSKTDDGAKSDSSTTASPDSGAAKSDTKSDNAKSDAAASSPTPSTGGASKESKKESKE